MSYTYHHSTRDITKFAVISTQRSGSTFFCDLISSPPEIVCHQEIFALKGAFFAKPIPPLSEPAFSLEKRNAQPIRFLDQVWQYRTEKIKAIGFKIQEGQNERILRHIIDDPDIRIIVIRRKNMLAGFVSLKVAEYTDVWNSRSALKKPPKKALPDSMTVNVEEFKEYIIRQNNFYDTVTNALIKTGKPFEQLEYEELQDQKLWANRVLKFLNVPTDVVLQSSLVKQGNYDLESFVLNYAEIKELLKE